METDVNAGGGATNNRAVVNGVSKSNGVAVNGASNDLSFNRWEGANLGNNAQTEKFRRLMGIKTNKAPQEIGGERRDDKKMFNDLEVGFEKARNTHFKAKGMGLGYS